MTRVILASRESYYLFIGESVPVIKAPIVNLAALDLEKSTPDPRHVLFGGTKIIELRVQQNQSGMEQERQTKSKTKCAPALVLGQ